MYSLKDFNVTKEVGVLKNGVRVVLFKKEKAPIFTSVCFKTGSVRDPIGKDGLAHFTEHMLFQGTTNFPTNAAFTKYFEEIGGGMNAGTSHETIDIDISIADKDDYNRVVTIVSEILHNLVITEDSVNIERGTILREIADINSSPDRALGDVFMSLIYQGTDRERSNIGSEETVNSITRDDLYSYYKHVLKTDDFLIIVCGDIEIKDLVNMYNNSLSDIQVKTRDPETYTPLPVVRDKSISIKKFTVNDQIHLAYGFRICDYYSDDTYPLIMVSSILGKGFNSTLFQKLRNDRGLVYGVDTDVYCGPQSGVFLVSTSTPKKHVQEVLDIISSEFNRVVTGGLTAAELDLAKKRLIKSKKRKMQTSGSWVGYHSFGEMFKPDKARDLAVTLQRIDEVTLEDIKRVGEKYLKKDSWYLAMCGDIEEKDFKVNF